ncbi:MAG: transcription-repair coupling factor [Acidobacteriota bacterium]
MMPSAPFARPSRPTAKIAETVWDLLSQQLEDHPGYRGVRERVEAGQPQDVQRLPTAAAAWVAQRLAGDLGRPLLVIVPREADALAWVEAQRLVSGEARSAYFPAPSLTPYQESALSLPVRARESAILDQLRCGGLSTVVATPRALYRRLPTVAAMERACRVVRTDEEHPPEKLLRHLLRYGYRRSDLVMEIGEIAIRGGVVDLFPPGLGQPVRLDLFGDTVESIRSFDPVDQRSRESLEELRIPPLSLFPSGSQEAQDLVHLLSEAAGPELGPEGAERLETLASSGEAPGWEHYLPLLASQTTSLLEWIEDLAAAGELPAGAPLVVALDPQALEDEVQHHAETMASEMQLRLDQGRLAVPPEELERPLHEVMGDLESALLRVEGMVLSQQSSAAEALDFHASSTDLFHGQLPRFATEVRSVRDRGERTVVVVHRDRRAQLVELLQGQDIRLGDSDGAMVTEGNLQRGFRLPAVGVNVYSEHQLFGRLAPVSRRSKARFGPFVSSLRDLKVGDYVVHSDHGIGQFVGLTTMAEESGPGYLPPSLEGTRDSGRGATEVMEVRYSKGKTLLLPLARLDQIQKYSGIEGVAPRLDTLGGTSWNRTKSRVKKSLRDMAGQLVKLYAERQMAEAPAMPDDSEWVAQFGSAFEFDETEDQLEAIATIKEDLQGKRPMDRLLCGDVGYGKTEVAMRAAFKAVDGGYQVALLAPTTILADQHLQTFRKRFEGFPVSVEMISRFRTPAQVRDIAKRLKDGKLDILIGTHRLLSRQLEFAKLGLLVVDEEQRFGVAQKERLKQLKKNVHVLAMSATPVPRTLQLSLAGVRDLSVIETPPKDRMAVETAILPFSSELIREAVEFELERGGQVYFVHNRVENIEAMQTFLRETVPQARVTVGHGQLDERELAKRMHAFTAGEFDILLATTIIENGIDIPNVNTMIVHHAERFGLAQLYQLRGRVGRSNQLAYCYLLVPGDKILTETARKRLAAIREFTDLGAGFRIAARDLEIRGAGNLLGAEQSGHIAAVGIETYLKMLDEAVRELRGETVAEGPSVSLDLPVAMSIPETYVSDANLRMEIYHKIAAAEAGVEEVRNELEDRFGAVPNEVLTLVRVGVLKRRAEELRIQAVSARRGKLVLHLRQDARVDIDRLIDLVGAQPGASLSPTGALTLPAASGEAVVSQIEHLLGDISPPTSASAPAPRLD